MIPLAPEGNPSRNLTLFIKSHHLSWDLGHHIQHIHQSLILRPFLELFLIAYVNTNKLQCVEVNSWTQVLLVHKNIYVQTYAYIPCAYICTCAYRCTCPYICMCTCVYACIHFTNDICFPYFYVGGLKLVLNCQINGDLYIWRKLRKKMKKVCSIFVFLFLCFCVLYFMVWCTIFML